MNYFLLKLSFDTAVHFGPSDSAQALFSSEDHLIADTVFSALCHTAFQLYGQAGIDDLCNWVQNGTLLLSDTMPWRSKMYFLPKPYITSSEKADVSMAQVKKMKKINWIPVNRFDEFSDSIHGGKIYEVPEQGVSFGRHTDRTLVTLSEDGSSTPYQLGLFQFDENCGLYIIAETQTKEQEEFLTILFHNLGLSGIGGKTSSGYGRFRIQKVALNDACTDAELQIYQGITENTGRSILLTSCLPSKEELSDALKGASYQLLRRSGFVMSNTYSSRPKKKSTQYFMRAGSVFSNRFAGDLYVVAAKGNHPVYRYSKPIFWGGAL